MSFSQDQLLQAKMVIQKTLAEVQDDLMAAYGSVEHQEKVDKTVVTQLDIEVEEQLRDALAKFDAGIAFSGEESGVDYDKSQFWLVDPIDGTDHFIRGIPFCSTMVALIVNGQPVMSVINHFASGDFFWAVQGGGAFHNEERIHVSDRRDHRAVIEFETRWSKSENADRAQSVREGLYGFLNTLSSGSGYTHVADGRIEGRVTLDGYAYPWDAAPGVFLVKEAGGKVANVGSESYDFRNTDVIAANPVMFDWLQQRLASN